MDSEMASMKGVYSGTENKSPSTPKEAAQELWDADLAVAEAEEDEAVGYGYDQGVRDRLERARSKYRDVTGTDAPARLTAGWLIAHN